MARQSTIDALMAVLPSSKIAAMRKTGLNRKTVLKVMEQLHREGKTHISGWEPHPVKGPRMAVYSVGAGEDAPCTLPRLTKHEVYVRFQKRHQKTEAGDRKRAKDRNRYWKKKAANQGDPLVNALFGRRAA